MILSKNIYEKFNLQNFKGFNIFKGIYSIFYGQSCLNF